jgi:CheY-like chemotaxis protein
MNQPTPPTTAVTNLPHICIVDDNQMAREVIADLLSTEGYEVSLASSGPEIIERIGDIQPDVILMDVMMPGMSGYDVCRLLKQEKRWQHIPIILVTALNGREDMLQGLKRRGRRIFVQAGQRLGITSQGAHHAAHQAPVRRPAIAFAAARRFGPHAHSRYAHAADGGHAVQRFCPAARGRMGPRTRSTPPLCAAACVR